MVLSFVNRIPIDPNDPVLMVELEETSFREDRASDVFMDEGCGHLETLTEEANGSLVIREPNEGNPTLPPGDWAPVQGKGLRQPSPSWGVVDNPRGAAAQLGIAVMLIMKGLKITQFLSQMNQIPKSLRAEKQFVIDIVEPFHNPVSPRLGFGDEDDLHPQIQTEADEEPEAARVAVGPSKGQFVVHLKVARNAQFLPGSHDGLDDVGVSLVGDGGQGHDVAGGVNEMDPIESAPALKIAGSHQVQLMDIIGLLGRQRRIGLATRLVGRFNHQALPFEDPVDGPDRRERLDAELSELPLDGQGSFLSVLSGSKPFPDFTDQALHNLRGLPGDSLGGPAAVLGPHGTAGIVASQPVIEPAPGSFQCLANGTNLFALEKSLNRMDASLLFLHRSTSCLEA